MAAYLFAFYSRARLALGATNHLQEPERAMSLRYRP